MRTLRVNFLARYTGARGTKIMSDKKLKCKVLAHMTGPKCGDCGSKMDKIIVETENHSYSSKVGHYCYPCSRDD